MIGSIISHFKILERIGVGGMGVVFKAEDLRVPGRVVAIKLLDAALVADENIKKRFLIEARAATSFDHPNICQIYEVDETDEGRPFMSMAYYGGPSLNKLLSSGPLDLLRSLQIAYSVAQGLACAHRHGIIHRDIKPANVMITDEGFVKIVDFGLARLAGETRITRTNVTLGTLAYMSPQQATGKDVDGRADIWSLGVVLYEMITGKLPFRGGIEQAMVYSIMNEDHLPACEANADVPEALSKIIDRCLEKDVEKRYQKVEALIEDLIQLARKVGWETTIVGATVAPVGWIHGRQRARRYGWVTVALLAVVVAGYAGFKLWPRVESYPYSTDLRIAVMPFTSKLGPDYNAYGAGLASITSDMLEDASKHHRSMWIVPWRFVEYTNPSGTEETRDAFGINRIVSGDIQRYGDEKRVTVRLQDTSGEALRSAVVDFAGEAPPAEDLARELFTVVGIDVSDPGEYSRFFPAGDTDSRDYTVATGLLTTASDSAAALLERVRQSQPGFGPARTTLGRVYFELYKDTADPSLVRDAIAELREGRAAAPSDPRAHYSLADVYRLTQEPDSAVDCFMAALRLSPGGHLAARGLGRTYRAQGRLDEARQVLETTAREREDFYGDYRALGKLCYRIGEYDAAARWLSQAIELAPGDVSSLNALGASYLNVSKWTEARSMFERAFQLSPNCDNCNNVGLMYYYESRFFDSAKYYETALSYCDSTDYQAWGNWASALYWVDGQRPRALAVYKKAIDLALPVPENTPDDAFLISSLIDFYAMSGMVSEAKNMIRIGLPYAANDPDMMFRVGSAYELLGDRTSALDHIGEAIRHDYPVEIIARTPALRELRLDARYQQMVADNPAKTQR